MDKELLFKPRVPEDEVEIPGVGTVRVRGLTRAEVFAMQKSKADGGIKTEAAWERRMLHLGLLDPEMTEDEVGQWQSISPAGEMEPVTLKISELSGLADDAEKKAMVSFRDEPGDGVRVLPGAEAVDDGEPAPGADDQ